MSKTLGRKFNDHSPLLFKTEVCDLCHKKSFLIFVILIFLVSLMSLSFIGAEKFSSNYEKSEISMSILNTIDSNAETLTVTLHFFPKDIENQEISITTTPDAEIKDDEIVFEFDEKGTLEIEVRAWIKRSAVIKKIDRVSLSESKFPEGFKEFTKSSTYILADDPFIKNKAQQLSTTDAFETLYNIAEYVRKSMEYDKEYQELKNASWIMQEKKGVCSHYTILFMSLVRSLGLATRYVSGMAYSNKEKKCGEHSWAEVYFPDYGWIPFDITFGQYAWLDSSHVVMMYSNDAGSASVSYRYVGEIKPENLKIDTKIENFGKEISLPLNVEIKPFMDKISLESYVPLKIKVKNPYNYYLALPFRVSIAPGVFGESEKILLLEPKGETENYFIVYLDYRHYEECGGGCIATLEVKDVFENSAITIVKFEKGATKITLSEAQKIASKYEKEGIDLYCKAEGEDFYDYEEITIKCVVTNNVAKKYLSLCHNEICKNFSIAKDERKEITLRIPASHIDIKKRDRMQCFFLCITAKENKDVLGISCVDIVILESPDIKIATFQNTQTKYGSKGNLQAIIESNTETEAELIIETQTYIEKQNISIEKGAGILNIPIKTWKLGIGENPIKLTLRYKDKRLKEYETKKDFLFTVKDVSMFKKIVIMIVHIFD